MIILDTNVISEPLRPAPDRLVTAWLDRQATETLFLTSTSLSELLVGLELLPPGKRRNGLTAAMSELLLTVFAHRILPFDEKAARAYAPTMVRAQSAGHTISVGDGQIAAIAATHGFSVATRDTRPFAAAGAPVINPWKSE